jgi:CRP-like cAMP-binding protein
MSLIADKLKGIQLFKEVEIADLEALVAYMEVQHMPQGTVVFYKNDPGDRMYIIQKGRIRIYMQNPDDETTLILTHYSENEIFGELSPIDQKPRSASASALEDLEVLVLTRENFLRFLDERPQIGLAMMRSLAQRLRNTTTYLEEYRPTRERRVVGSEVLSRREAQAPVAQLLDTISGKMNREDLLKARAEAIESAAKKAELPPTQPTPPANIANLGIFDRIARSEKLKGEGENPPQDPS